MNYKMSDNPAYVDIVARIEELNATNSRIRSLMGQAPISRNPFSNTNKLLRAQNFQTKVIEDKIDMLYDLLFRLQQEWEATTVW